MRRAEGEKAVALCQGPKTVKLIAQMKNPAEAGFIWLISNGSGSQFHIHLVGQLDII